MDQCVTIDKKRIDDSEISNVLFMARSHLLPRFPFIIKINVVPNHIFNAKRNRFAHLHKLLRCEGGDKRANLPF